MHCEDVLAPFFFVVVAALYTCAGQVTIAPAPVQSALGLLHRGVVLFLLPRCVGHGRYAHPRFRCCCRPVYLRRASKNSTGPCGVMDRPGVHALLVRGLFYAACVWERGQTPPMQFPPTRAAPKLSSVPFLPCTCVLCNIALNVIFYPNMWPTMSHTQAPGML